MSAYVHGASPAAQAQRVIDDARDEAASLVADARREAMRIVSAARQTAHEILHEAEAARAARPTETSEPAEKILEKAALILESRRPHRRGPAGIGALRLAELDHEVRAAADAAARRPATMAITPAPANADGRAA